MKDTNTSRPASVWLIPAIYLGISVLIMMAGEPGKEWLRYDRVWIGQGEIWRLLTAHVTHMSWSHLALNGAGLLLVWYLVASAYDDRRWILIIGVTLATIDVAFWFLHPELYWYVGMSGLLHGLLAAGLVARWQSIDAETSILLALLIAKISWEQYAGPVPGSVVTSGGPVIVDAHLYGALGGVLAGLLARIRVRPSAPI